MASLSQKMLYGSSMLATGLIITTLMGFLRWIIIIRLLSVFEYGVLAITLVTLTIANVTANLRIDRAVIKFIAEKVTLKQFFETKQIFFSTLLLKIILSSIVCFVFIITSNFIGIYVYEKSSVIIPIQLISIGIIPFSLLSTVLATLQGMQEFKLKMVLNILQKTLDFIMSVSLVVAGFGVIGVVISYVITVGIVSFLGFIIVFRKFLSVEGRFFEVFNLKIIKMIMSFSKWLVLSAMLSFFYDQFNTLLIGILMVEEDVAKFRVAFRLSAYIALIAQPIYQTLFPIQTELYTGDKISLFKRTYRDATKFLAIVVIPIAFFCIILATPIVQLVAGTQYISVVPIFRILILRTAIYNLSIAIGPSLIAMDRPDIIPKIQFLTALSGVSTSVILIPSYGIFGGAVSELIIAIVGLTIGFISIFYVSKIPPPLGSLLKFSFSAIFAATITYLVLSINLFIILKIFIALVAGFLVYFFSEALLQGLNNDDISMLKILCKNNAILTQFLPLIKFLDKLRKLRAY